jgi:hypothetical protein
MSVANVVTQKSRLPSRLRPRAMDDTFLARRARCSSRGVSIALPAPDVMTAIKTAGGEAAECRQSYDHEGLRKTLPNFRESDFDPLAYMRRIIRDGKNGFPFVTIQPQRNYRYQSTHEVHSLPWRINPTRDSST